MASIGEHLLAELASGEGCDVALVLGADRERSSYHSFVLRRAEYFKTGLSGGFVEQQRKEFVLDDVLPKHMKPLMHALYSDKLPEKEVDAQEAQDLWTMLTLCKRFLFPAAVMGFVGAKFSKKLASEKARTAVELVEMIGQCVDMSFPDVVSNALFKAFEKALVVNKSLGPEAYLDILAGCGSHSLPKRVVNAADAAFKGKLTWGVNVLATMALASAKNVRAAEVTCLNMITIHHLTEASMTKEIGKLTGTVNLTEEACRDEEVDGRILVKVQADMIAKAYSVLAANPLQTYSHPSMAFERAAVLQGILKLASSLLTSEVHGGAEGESKRRRVQ